MKSKRSTFLWPFKAILAFILDVVVFLILAVVIIVSSIGAALIFGLGFLRSKL